MNFPVLSVILLAPVIGALVILFIPEKEEKLIKITAAVSASIPLLLSIALFVLYDKNMGGMQFVESIPWVDYLGISYTVGVDGLSLPMVLLTSLVIFTGVFASWDMHSRIKEFFIFLLILTAGVFGVFIAMDLFFFYLFFEVALIPMYVLIGLWGSTRKEYAAMKLTLYLLIGSVFALIAIIATFLYAAAPEHLGFITLDMVALGTVTYDVAFQKFAFFLMLIGFGFLVPMWPFHTWSPDGHVAAPTAVSMLHAGVIMKLGGYGLIRLGIFYYPEGAKYWAPLIALLCRVNVVYGALVAMVQKDLKFVIGYSSVSHMGYVLLGIAALNTLSLDGAVTQMFAHGIMTALFFALVGHIYHGAHTREIARFGGLAHQMPRVAAGFVIAGLAALGLPGLNNFVAEFLIFLGAFSVDQTILGFISFRFIAILGILGIVITATYVLRVVQFTFFGPRKEEWNHLKDAKGIQLVPIVVLIGTLLLFGVYPAPLVDLINTGVEPLVEKIQAAAAIRGIF